jgi:hypothetical protein
LGAQLAHTYLIFVELLELVRCEIRTQISDDSVGKAESMQDIADEGECSIKCELRNRLVFNSLCKLAAGYQHMSETSWCCCQWPDHIKAPASKQPRWSDGDKIMSRDM